MVIGSSFAPPPRHSKPGDPPAPRVGHYGAVDIVHSNHLAVVMPATPEPVPFALGEKAAIESILPLGYFAGYDEHGRHRRELNSRAVDVRA